MTANEIKTLVDTAISLRVNDESSELAELILNKVKRELESEQYNLPSNIKVYPGSITIPTPEAGGWKIISGTSSTDIGQRFTSTSDTFKPKQGIYTTSTDVNWVTGSISIDEIKEQLKSAPEFTANDLVKCSGHEHGLNTFDINSVVSTGPKSAIVDASSVVNELRNIEAPVQRELKTVKPLSNHISLDKGAIANILGSMQVGTHKCPIGKDLHCIAQQAVSDNIIGNTVSLTPQCCIVCPDRNLITHAGLVMVSPCNDYKTKDYHHLIAPYMESNRLDAITKSI